MSDWYDGMREEVRNIQRAARRKSERERAAEAQGQVTGIVMLLLWAGAPLAAVMTSGFVGGVWAFVVVALALGFQWLVRFVVTKIIGFGVTNFWMLVTLFGPIIGLYSVPMLLDGHQAFGISFGQSVLAAASVPGIVALAILIAANIQPEQEFIDKMRGW